MDSSVNVPGGNPGGKANYFLNNDTTVKKLKAAANKENLKVTDNSGSKTIEFSTGAYICVVLPLIRMWQEMKGHSILPSDVDGMDISVVQIDIERDLAGTILHYMVELKVQGRKVKVTCYDTTLSMFVQSGKMLDEYFSRVLFPYLNAEIKGLGRIIDEKNSQVRAHGEPRQTRQTQKESLKGAASLEPPSTPRVLETPSTSRRPRLLAYSSPVPKILPLALLPPAQKEVEVLHPPVMQQVQEYQEILLLDDDVTEGETLRSLSFPSPLPSPLAPRRLALEMQPLKRQLLTRLTNTASKEVTVEELLFPSPTPSSRTLPAQLVSVPDAELEARHGLLEAIVTSRSQIVPDVNWRMEVNCSIAEQEEEDENADDAPNGEQKDMDKASKDDKVDGSTKNDVIVVENAENKEENREEEKRHMDRPQEQCTVCGKLFQTADSLQIHLLSNHSLQAEAVLQLVKKQEETISEMHSVIKQISASQINMLDEMKHMRRTLMVGHASVDVFPPPAPPVPAPPASILRHRTHTRCM